MKYLPSPILGRFCMRKLLGNVVKGLMTLTNLGDGMDYMPVTVRVRQSDLFPPPCSPTAKKAEPYLGS